jgi:hypothetical protein
LTRWPALSPTGRTPNRVSAAIFGLCVLCAGSAGAEMADHSYLLDLYAGSSRSDLVRDLRSGGYDLAGGETVDFADWYSGRLPDLTLLFLTPLNDNLGLAWGLSTGESGRKYRIQPAFHLGLTWQAEVFRNATLSASVHTVLGGRLREKSCVADYGSFGISEVNCRLAASQLPPEETLGYLLDVSARHESRISLRFEYRF